MTPSTPAKKVVILISGRGSNMQAIVEARLSGCRVVAVMSNHAEAAGLEFARQHGIATAVLSHRDFADRASFDAALAAEIDLHTPDFVVLAGFMRILTPAFVAHFAGRLINIHPSLLPAYPGLHTHRRALDDGVKIHGCTVHFVTAELDHGPIIAQAAIPVLDSDGEAELAARLLRQEHRIYPQALADLCSGAVWLDADSGKVISRKVARADAALLAPVWAAPC